MSAPQGIRALLITTDYPPEIGGLQTYAYRIARELPLGLLAMVLVGRSLAHATLPLPQDGISLASRRGRNRLSAFLWSLWSIPYFHFYYGINFQLHMQWSTAIPSWIMKKLGLRSPYIVLIHGAEIIDPGRHWLGSVKKVVLEGANAVVAGSRHTAEILGQLGISCQNLEIVTYGNPLDGCPEVQGLWEKFEDPGLARSSRNNNPPRLLCMHRLVARKGTALLLEALSKLMDRPWTLDIVGEGPEKNLLKAKVKALGLDSRVRFHEPVVQDQKIKMMQVASLFILPSLPPVNNNFFEGLGLTLLEAQSLGLPVLAARTGGIPEAIQEGRTGVLFRAGDADDLRAKLGKLLFAPEQLASLGSAGPKWVHDHFSWKESLGRLAEIMIEAKEKENFKLSTGRSL
jgi:phosphatidyl-myo-inositol dimannoside synthase